MAQSNNHALRQVPLSGSGLVVVGFLAVGGYFLWAEHQAHVLIYLPLILILGVCLGMNFFMHGGHGGGHGPHDDESGEGGR